MTAATCQHRQWPCEFVDEVEWTLPKQSFQADNPLESSASSMSQIVPMGSVPTCITE